MAACASGQVRCVTCIIAAGIEAEGGEDSS